MTNNWEHKKMTIDELKELVREVYDCKVFTSLQCENRDVTMIFMPAMFMGAGPTEPSLGSNNQLNRKNKLKYIEDMLIFEEEKPEREEFFKNIGMLYEDYSKAGPRGINGYPMFMSCKIVSVEDTGKFVEMYKKYEEMRENFEKEWGTENKK